MAGAIEKKKNEVVTELEGSPTIHIDARAAILSDIALSREFAQTYLQALCTRYGSNPYYTLNDICQNLAKQRMICMGAKAIKDSSSKFTLPTFHSVNGALDLTEANTSFFGYVSTDLLENNAITLQNTAGTQTIEGNTFSTQITDYYLVRSRVSGELEDISGNLSAYTTPDGSDDNVFGNAIAWGSSVAGEQSANTWNYHWAKCNVASVAVSGSGGVFELKTITLADHLTQGSNTDYTPQGPGFGQKFYLKRHADKVNQFTITGTTTTGSVEITSISDTDIAKVKYNDVISGTGIPEGAGGAPKVAAAMSSENKIRMGNITYTTGTVGQAANVVTLSSGTWPADTLGGTLTLAGGGGNVVSRDSDTQVTLDNTATVSTGTSYSLSHETKATANGTVTLTVNSVPFGHAAHDIFCQLEVSGEGLVANSTWTPVGDLAGTYATGSEHDLCIANTSQFISLLSFFDPSNAGSDDLIKGASADYVSEGKEYNEVNYPDIVKNPIFPATGGTSKAYATKNGEITGTQPSGLTDKDTWCGRFVSWNKGRENAAGAVTEFRYKIDNAEKYFYAPPSNLGYDNGTVDQVADPNHPPTQLASYAATEAEPRNICPRLGMTPVVTRVSAASVTIGATAVTTSHTTTIPADDAICYAPTSGSGTGPQNAAAGGVAGSGDRNGSIGNYYTIAANGICCIHHTQVSIDVTVTSSGTTHTLAYTEHNDGPFQCYYNHVQKHLFEASTSTANTDVAFIMDTVDQLQLVDGFRDPITTGTAAPRSASGGTAGDANGTGISDADFDTYLASEPEGDYNLLQTGMTKFRANFAASGRVASRGVPGSGSYPRCLATGSAVNFASFTQDSVAYNCQTLWTNYVAEIGTFKDNCDKRIREVDARIGVPTYSGSASSRGTPPAIRVSAIPASNTTNGVLPYGRSIFNSVNHLLGKDVDLLGGIIKDIESLGNLVDLIKTARNKYEILSGRDKEYS